jgi:hypothetical protein
MSRAINVNATEVEVAELCAKHSVSISASEALPAGGTRVVLTTGAGADTMRNVFGEDVISRDVPRTAFTQSAQR